MLACTPQSNAATVGYGRYSPCCTDGIRGCGPYQGSVGPRSDVPAGTPTRPWCGSAYRASLGWRDGSLQCRSQTIDTAVGGLPGGVQLLHTEGTDARHGRAPSFVGVPSSVHGIRRAHLAMWRSYRRTYSQMCVAMPRRMRGYRSFSGSVGAAESRVALSMMRRLSGPFCTGDETRRVAWTTTIARDSGEYRMPFRNVQCDWLCGRLARSSSHMGPSRCCSLTWSDMGFRSTSVSDCWCSVEMSIRIPSRSFAQSCVVIGSSRRWSRTTPDDQAVLGMGFRRARTVSSLNCTSFTIQNGRRMPCVR